MFTKTHQEIVEMFEDPEKYEKRINKISKEIANANKDYIISVLDMVNTALSSESFQFSSKYTALQLLKDCMLTGQHLFAKALAKCEIVKALEDLAISLKEKPSITLDQLKMRDFLGECFSLWGKKYKNTQDFTNGFSAAYERLKQAGFKFKDTYDQISLEDVKKFNEIQIPEKAFQVSGQEVVRGKSSSLTDNNPVPKGNNSNTQNTGSPKKKPTEDEVFLEKLKKLDEAKLLYRHIINSPFAYNAQELQNDEIPFNAFDMKTGGLAVVPEHDSENSISKTDFFGSPAQSKDEMDLKRSFVSNSSTPGIDVRKSNLFDVEVVEEFDFTAKPDEKTKRSSIGGTKRPSLDAKEDKTLKETTEKPKKETKEEKSSEKSKKEVQSSVVVENLKENKDKEPTMKEVPLVKNASANSALLNDEEKKKLKEKLEEMTRLNKQLQDRNELLQKTLNDERKQRQIEKDQEALNRELDLNGLNSKINELLKELDIEANKAATLAQENQNLQSQNEELHQQVKNKEDELQSISSGINSTESTLLKVSKERDAKQQEVNNLKKELDRLNSTIQKSDNEREKAALQENKTLKDRVQTLEKQLKDLEKEKDDDISRLKREISKKDEDSKIFLEGMKDAYKSEMKKRDEQFKSILQQKDQEFQEKLKEKDIEQRPSHLSTISMASSTPINQRLTADVGRSRDSFAANPNNASRDKEREKSEDSGRKILSKTERVKLPSRVKEAKTLTSFYSPTISTRQFDSVPLSESLSPNGFKKSFYFYEGGYTEGNESIRSGSYKFKPFGMMSPKSETSMSMGNLKSPKSVSNFASARSNGVPDRTNYEQFQLACMKDKALVYEDDVLAIECYCKLERDVARSTHFVNMSLLYQNKTDKTMEDFEVTYKNTPGFEMSADEKGIEPHIGPLQEQVHLIHVNMVHPQQSFASIVIQYKIGNLLEQKKVKIPLVITKFLHFRSITSTEFIVARKQFLLKNPDNFVDSEKIRLNPEHFEVFKTYILSKLTLLPMEGRKNDRFTLLGGSFYIDTTNKEFFIRVIIEKDTRLALFQLTYEAEYSKYAERIAKTLSFISGEKTSI